MIRRFLLPLAGVLAVCDVAFAQPRTVDAQVPHVRDAGGVCEQVANRDPGAGVLAIVGQHVCQAAVERQSALLDELQHQDRCELLGHGSDQESSFGHVGQLAFEVCEPVGGIGDGPPAFRDQYRAARHATWGDEWK